MRFIYKVLFFLFLLAAPWLTRAQSITVIDETDSKPIEGVHIFCTNLNKHQEEVFFSDKNGKAQLNHKEGRYALSIYMLGFARIYDTLDNTNNKSYKLKIITTDLNELVVTAQYAPNSTDKAVHNIRIIDQKKIAAMGAVNLRDVLTNEMNIRISQDNILGSSMSVQGISGENVKILIDGIASLGRVADNVDISQINMNNVERIEIVEGPLSVSYGTDALAGTINIITKKNKGHKFSGDINTYYESFGQYNLTGNIGYNYKNNSFRLSAGRNYFDGWNPGDKQFNYDSHPIADTSRAKQWNPKEQYFTTFNYGHRFKGLQFYYTLDYFKEKITDRGLPQVIQTDITALDNTYKTNRTNNAISVDGNLSPKFRLNGFIAYNYYRRNKNEFSKDLSSLEQAPTTGDGDQDTSIYKTVSSRATISTINKESTFNYELGYDARAESAQGLRIEGNKQSLGDYAAFGTSEWRPIKNLAIRPGVRVAYNTRYKSPVVPSLNFKYTIPTAAEGSSFTVRGSYARGFRAPTLKELYFDFVDANHHIFGNTDLKSETSDNFNFSANYSNTKGDWSTKTEISLFHNVIKDKIDLAINLAESKPNYTVYGYFNVSQAKVYGTQFQQSVSYKHLKITVGASYIASYNELSKESDIDKYSYSPEIKANLFYEWYQQQMTFGFFYKYNGSQQAFQVGTSGEIEKTQISGYQWADCSVSKGLFQRKLNISAGVKNMFDIQSIAGTSTISNAPHGGGSSLPIGMGRSYFASLVYRFNAD